MPASEGKGDLIETDASTPADINRPVVDEDLVRKTAGLARLQVSDEEIPALIDHLEKMLDMVETLRAVEVPDGHRSDADAPQVEVNETRVDQPVEGDDPGGPRDRESIGNNCSDWRDGTFVTPRVVG